MPGCLFGNAVQVDEVVLNNTLMSLEKTDGVKTPVDRPGSKFVAELLELDQTDINGGYMRLKSRRLIIDGEIEKENVEVFLQFFDQVVF